MNLLPASSTKLERALAQTMGRFSPPVIVNALWNQATCPASILPWLAQALSVDDWDPTWSVDRKRQAIIGAREIHRSKGTPLAIRRALAIVGQPDADLIERADSIRRNGTAHRNGWHRRKGLAGWATYRVILKRPVTIDQAQLIYRLLDSVKRNCIHLVALDFSRAALSRNGMANRDGQYTRGIIS